MNTIPKIIYYCWFGEEKPKKVLDCINNWREKLPNYEIIEINEHNNELFDIKQECQNNRWFKTVWENKMWAYVADYVRLKVLYERGGVYLDTDVTIEKDITELVEKNKLVLGWQEEKSVGVGICIVGAKNPLIKEMFDFYKEKIWNSELYTIPQIVTYVIKRHYNLNPYTEVTENESIIIFPIEYFYPVPANCHISQGYLTDNTYTIHWWDASWVKENIKYFLEHKNIIKLDELLKIAFEEHIVYKNLFVTIRKIYHTYNISFDFDYLFRFKSKFYRDQLFLIIIIMGFQIKLWKRRIK